MPRGPAFKRKFRAPKRCKSLFCRVMGLACFGKHCTIGQGWDRIAAPRPVGADVSSRQSGPGLEAMLRPFLDRSVPPRTIIAVDCHWDQLSPATGVSTHADAPTSASRCFSRSPSLTAGALRYRRVHRRCLRSATAGLGCSLDSIVRHASKLRNGASGDRSQQKSLERHHAFGLTAYPHLRAGVNVIRARNNRASA